MKKLYIFKKLFDFLVNITKANISTIIIHVIQILFLPAFLLPTDIPPILVCSVGFVIVSLVVAVAVTVGVVVPVVAFIVADVEDTVGVICCLLTVFILRLVTPCGLVVAKILNLIDINIY